jgi:lipopolysaccharide export system protein LptA
MLIGNARVWEEDNVVSGDTITLFISQERAVVQGNQHERVKAVFNPRDTARADADGAGRRPAEPCRN